MPIYQDFNNEAITSGYSSVDLTFSVLFSYHWTNADRLERVVVKHCHPCAKHIIQGNFPKEFGLQTYKEYCFGIMLNDCIAIEADNPNRRNKGLEEDPFYGSYRRYIMHVTNKVEQRYAHIRDRAMTEPHPGITNTVAKVEQRADLLNRFLYMRAP